MYINYINCDFVLQDKLCEQKLNTQRLPPPYHIAAIYSKQVSIFNNENLT